MSTRIQVNTDEACTINVDGSIEELHPGDVRSFTVGERFALKIVSDQPAPDPNVSDPIKGTGAFEESAE